MEIKYLLHLLLSHWRFVTIASVVALLTGLAASYILPEDYVASTKILLRPRQEITDSPSAKAMMDFPVTFNIPADTMSETYAEVMTSEAIARRVVDELKLHELTGDPDPRWYLRFYNRLKNWVRIGIKYTWDFVRFGRVERKDPYDKAIEDVLDGLQAQPIGDTYLFSLSATWDRPGLAARIANTAAQAFLDYNLEAKRNEDGTSAAFLRERLQQLEVALDEDRGRLDEFYRENEVSDLNRQLALKIEDLYDFETDRGRTEKELREVEAELATVENQLGSQTENVHSGTVMARNPVLDQLQEEIARYEVELAGLEQTHQAAHPEVKSIMAKVQQARKRMSEVDPQVRMQDTSALNPIHENLERKVLDRIAQRDLLLSRGAALDDVIAKMRGEVQELSHQKAEYGRLSLALDLREVEYRLVSEEYAEARLAAAEDISEIRILHPAIPPVYPEGPWKILYAGGGLAIGFLLAFSVLLVRDYAEPALVTAEDVQEALDAPVLATVPRKNMPAGTIALLGEGSSSDAFAWRMLLEDESHVKGGSGDE